VAWADDSTGGGGGGGSGGDVKVAERPEAVESEADIFNLLGMPYKTPKERDI